MKVWELCDLLAAYDSELEVVIQRGGPEILFDPIGRIMALRMEPKGHAFVETLPDAELNNRGILKVALG